MKIDDQRRSQKARHLKKSKLNALLEDNSELRPKLKISARCGQPKIEEEQPLLLQTILDIAMHGSASQEKRQSEIYSSIKTLDQLTEHLKKKASIYVEVDYTFVYFQKA